MTGPASSAAVSAVARAVTAAFSRALMRFFSALSALISLSLLQLAHDKVGARRDERAQLPHKPPEEVELRSSRRL
jgi:hypothetical protein